MCFIRQLLLKHLFISLQLKELQYRVLDQELNKWKREQQLSGNGAPFTNNLDTIQKWYQNDFDARFGDEKFVVGSVGEQEVSLREIEFVVWYKGRLVGVGFDS